MSQNTPTPRTDLQVKLDNLTNDKETVWFVSAYFARQLERELIAAKAKIAELKGLFEKYAQHLPECSKGRHPFIGDSCDLDAALKKVREM